MMDEETLKQVISLQLDLLVAMNEDDTIQSWSAGIEQRANQYEQFVTRLQRNGQLNAKALGDIQKHFGLFTK